MKYFRVVVSAYPTENILGIFFCLDLLRTSYLTATLRTPVRQALLLRSKLHVMHFMPGLPLITFAAFLHCQCTVKRVK